LLTFFLTMAVSVGVIVIMLLSSALAPWSTLALFGVYCVFAGYMGHAFGRTESAATVTYYSIARRARWTVYTIAIGLLTHAVLWGSLLWFFRSPLY